MNTEVGGAKKRFDRNLANAMRRLRRCIRRVNRKGLLELLPGALGARGTTLAPVSMPLLERFDSFVIDLTTPQEEILNFSSVCFIGEVAGQEGLQDVSSLAVCSQSSVHEKMPDPYTAVKGGRFATNVHSLREKNPWWRADFPESVTVRHVYFYHRVVRGGVRMNTLRIRGLTAGGGEAVLHHPASSLKRHVYAQVDEAIHGLRLLRRACQPHDVARFDEHARRALDLLGLVSDTHHPNESQKGGGRVPILRQLVARVRMARRGRETDGQTLQRAVVSELLAACEVVLGGVRDFGYTPEEGRLAFVGQCRARFLRVRTFNGDGLGIGGLSLHQGAPDAPPLHSFEKMAIRNEGWLAAYKDEVSFALNLAGKTGYRVIELDGPVSFNHIRLWNRNRRRADGTMFTEIAISQDGEEWQSVYDHGAAYRAIMTLRPLMDMLVGDDWPVGYAKLMGRLYTLYRCRSLARPFLQTLRHKQALLEEVVAGSREAGAQISFAYRLLFTKHGMHIPLSERDEDKLIADLVTFRDTLGKLGLKPFLLYGTLLGAIREKGFIQHDDDLDTAIIVDGLGPEDLVAERDRLTAYLQENGVKCKAVPFSTPLIHYTHSTVSIDIFVLGHKDGKIYWPHHRLAIREERADIFLPLGELEFKGEIFAAPKDPEAVTEARYGEGWRIPQPTFGL